MNRMVAKSGVAAFMGMILLSGQGCSTKWLQSGGENETGSAQLERVDGKIESNSAQSGFVTDRANSNIPGISRRGSSGELSGFSRNPSEERVAQTPGDFPASVSPAELQPQSPAELQAQRGFSTSQTPAELTSLPPAESGGRRRAELTKEEKEDQGKMEEVAALEAGLQDVFFGYDQWTLSSVGMEALNRDAGYLKDHPGALLKIEGHCDERGTGDYNLVLGDKRAKAARSYLIEAGVSPKQVAIVSYGKERPFCIAHEESCYQQNRRGHMLLGTKK